MLDSLEGKRGEVRAKPPIPAISGLFGQPTVINNVLSAGGGGQSSGGLYGIRVDSASTAAMKSPLVARSG